MAKDLADLFDDLRQLHFEDRLPRCRVVRSPRLDPGTDGDIDLKARYIRLRPGLPPQEERGALIHEMVHLWVGVDGHSPLFLRKLHEIEEAGEASVQGGCKQYGFMTEKEEAEARERGEELPEAQPWEAYLSDILHGLSTLASQTPRPRFDRIRRLLGSDLGLTPEELPKYVPDIRKRWREACRDEDRERDLDELWKGQDPKEVA